MKKEDKQLANLGVEDRFKGCLLGLAIGDAVGTTLEFKARGTFSPIKDMEGGGPFELEKGQWTDDTSMALCLAHSLVYKQGFDAIDQMNRYCNWWQWGYMSSTGDCFDIGATVVRALSSYLETKNPFSGSYHPDSAGNGSLMRLAPIAMFYHSDLDALVKYAGDSSRTTHAAEECIDSCRYFATLLHQAFNGKTKAEIITSSLYKPSTLKVHTISQCEYLEKNVNDIRGSGYVIDCLEAALWCFAKTDSFEAAILAAANLGDDADTTAAVCGQIAGAYYGVNGIKREWLDAVHMNNEIEMLSENINENRTRKKNTEI
ncbi:MAG: ADP-ribosylglycohydrolase family protein [Gammaproteobacteria bacterium]|nr:ADP-ribosylglycohydrolase family protein [Gammaproteobacteria bacterium]